MYIGIDGNEANVSNRVGSNVYAHRILEGIHKDDPRTNYLVYLKSSPLKDLPRENKNWQYNVFGPKPLWTQWRLPLELYKDNPRPSLFFTPGHYAPRLSPVPTVISIMDLAFHYYPEAFKPKVLRQLKSWTRYSVNNAAHILTISHHSKKDLIKLYGVPEQKISVTHLGSNLEKPAQWDKTAREAVMKKYKIPSKYFIFVGTRQPRKNLNRLITAFLKVQAHERNIFLVIVGKTWHQFADAHLPTNANIIFTGFVPDDDLSQLICASEALVLPSLYEGFCIPVLEAMQLGTLVAASNSSSIPEITGESNPFLFNPTKTDQIQAYLEEIIHLPDTMRKKLIREGKIRANQFSWERTSQQTIKILQQLALGRI